MQMPSLRELSTAGRLSRAGFWLRHLLVVAPVLAASIAVQPWAPADVLLAVWADAPGTGSNLLRRWERRFALSTELLVKEGYARLIKLGTQSIYDAPKP